MPDLIFTRAAPPQLTDGHLARMTPAEVNAARRAGSLDALMGRTSRPTEPDPDVEPDPVVFDSPGAHRTEGAIYGGQVTDAALHGMSAAQINQARHDGRLDHLLGIYR